MGVSVVMGAAIKCTMGLSPGQLLVTSQAKCLAGGKPMATIQDIAPLTNITPCGLCTSMANPTVASATAAALGVLTPMPCVPAPVGVWTSSGKPLVANLPGLDQTSTIACAYAGMINIVNPGQTKVLT